MKNWNTLFDENRAAWDARVPIHAASRFYNLDGFRLGASSLMPVERALLGDVRGQKLLHLQCHFGLDTLSLARLGADVVGVDFSAKAVELARSLAAELALPARFVESSVYELREHVSEVFDIAFTSYGVLGWLPDLGPWAKAIYDSLRPEGRLVLVEFHPFVWMSQKGPDFAPRYSYFNAGTITESESGTYAEPGAAVTLKSHDWNHPLSDVINALIRAGLTLERLDEHDYSPWDIFPNLKRGEDGFYRFASAPGLVPILFSLVASRPRQ